MGLFSNLFSGNKQEKQLPQADPDEIVSEIKKAEQSNEIPLGKKIYSFDFGGLQVRFDRDITHNGRFCIFEGRERLYSFTVFAKEGEYDILKDSLESIIQFLNGNRNIREFPDSELFKGFYYGH